ncbi:helix-turn-helix domain-containing protein [Saccharospirillum alexandrii]|uniref:helix-turn-helix domain-containing protein n=1 Tax=Saccharospirillum alexandrii TaxID=2448477 RepID=UPI003735871E
MPRTDYQAGIDEHSRALFTLFAANIKEARKARGWTIQEAADRAFLSVTSYRAAEAGNLGTAIGVYLAILGAMGLSEGFADLAAPNRDETGRRNRIVKAQRKVTE